MPSPGKQRGGGSKSGQSGPRGGGRRTGVGPSGQSGIDKSPGYRGRDKGSYALGERPGYEDRADKRAKPSASANPPKYHMSEEEKKAEKKAYKEKSGPVKTATKAQKQRMQKTLEKQRRKGLAKKGQKAKQMISDSSKTPGETKPKRTGGGGTRFMPKIGGGPYKRTTISQRLRRILE